MHDQWTGFAVRGVAGLLALGVGVALSLGAWFWALAAGASWAAISFFGPQSMSRRPSIGSQSGGPSAESPDSPIYDSDTRALLDAVPALISVMDSDMRFEYANRAQQDLFGRPDQSVAGISVLELVGESGFARIEPHARRALEGEEVRFEVEIPNQKPGGRPLHFDTVFVPRLDSDGTVSGYYSLATDISWLRAVETERRTFEQQVMQTEKLESRGILAGGIAHDFNNLLVSMMTNVDIIRRDLTRVAAVDDELREIEVAAQNAATLCRQMLDYSGQGRVEFERVDLTRLASELPELLKTSLPGSVSLELDPNSPTAPVQGDPDQLREVIMSLITNSWESMSDGQNAIAISTGAIDADAETLSRSYIDDKLPPGRYSFIQVSGSGCGISEEVMSNLFDPFFSTKFTGRGLGLSAALGIVRGHRGAITVESKPDVGTQIRVLIPFLEWQAKPKSPQEFDSISDWRASGTVLVVDDDAGLRRATHRILTGCGLNSLMAASGGEALEIINGLPPGTLDLIVLDLTMPVMDGAETLASIRKIDAQVPVLLCSGYTEAEVTQRCKGLEYSGMLAKPFGFYTFAHTIRSLLEP